MNALCPSPPLPQLLLLIERGSAIDLSLGYAFWNQWPSSSHGSAISGCVTLVNLHHIPLPQFTHL